MNEAISAQPSLDAGNDTPGPDVSTLSEQDKAVIGRVLSVIRTARGDVDNDVKAVREKAIDTQLIGLGYLSGYLDGSGLSDLPQAHRGFQGLTSTMRAKADVAFSDASLADLTQRIQTPTRFEPVGGLIGGVIALVGVGLRALGEYVQGGGE